MEPVVKTSFIPSETKPTLVKRSSGGMTDLLTLAALVLFVASLALAVAVFLYAQYLETSKGSKSAQLERARAAFEPTLIQTLTRLDDRMHSADSVLGAHIAPSIFFRLLEEVTLQTVSFSTLTFDATDPGRLTIKMRGLAESVNAIALQADLFTKNGVIASPIFSNIDREMDGVHFDVSALVNQNAIRYTSLYSSAAAALEQGTPGEDTIPVGGESDGETPDPFGQQND